MTDKKSLDHVSYWMEIIQKERQTNKCQDDELAIVLIGNKCDLGDNGNNDEKQEENENTGDDDSIEHENMRGVTEKEGLAKAEEFGIKFIETSAKTGKNIDKAFTMALECWCKKQHDIMDDKLEQMSNEKIPKSFVLFGSCVVFYF